MNKELRYNKLKVKSHKLKINKKLLSFKIIILLFFAYCPLFTTNSFSQGISINKSGVSADVSSILDISSTSQGLLLPRLTTSQRDAIVSPALSLLIFNTTTNCFEAYVNDIWFNFSCPPKAICQQFQKTFGGIGDESISIAQQTIDGGYVMAGTTKSFGAGGNDFYLIKLDADGDLIWSRTYGGNGEDDVNSMQQTRDGGYVITGWTYSFRTGGYDIYFVKTNSSGDLQWSRTYGGAGANWANSIEQTTDGGYIISAGTNNFGAGGQDVYLLRTDSSGNLLWSKTYGGSSSEQGFYVKQAIDGGYVITGYTFTYGAGADDIYLIKTDESGNLLWSKTYGGVSSDIPGSIQLTSDGGYIIGGFTSSFGTGGGDIFLIRTDGSGNLSWSRTYGGAGYDRAYTTQQTSEGGYIMAGTTNSFGAGGYEVYLVKADGSGNLMWSRTFGGKGSESGSCVNQTNDGGYFITGGTSSFGAGNSDFYVIKTDGSGNGRGCNSTSPTTIVNTPNPKVNSPALTVTNPATIVSSPPTIVGNPATNTTTLCTKCN
jgi:hypothetical protein